MKDPNTHFNEHNELESQLISLLEQIPIIFFLPNILYMWITFLFLFK